MANRITQLYESALSPHAQEVVGFILLVLSLIGWPLSAFTWARSEPPFILGLSWGAVVLTAYCILVAARADKHIQEGMDE
jgi:hypothetical protein